MKNIIFIGLLSLGSLYASSSDRQTFIQNGRKVKLLFCDQYLKCNKSTPSLSLNRYCEELGFEPGSAYINENPEVCPDERIGTACGCVVEEILD